MRFLVCVVLFLSACTGVPKGIEPVENFDLDKYLGTWYEIARLDHFFERGLSNVSARYTLAENGDVVVENRGYSASKNKWKQAIGKAGFKGESDVGHLKVSFFGPFYASYVVFELDDYQQSFVVGNKRKFLWYLSRTRSVSESDRQKFLQKAKSMGFNVDDLIWVDQKDPDQ